MDFVDMELIRRMNYHGYVYIEGGFSKPYTDGFLTISEAEQWLKSLQADSLPKDKE